MRFLDSHNYQIVDYLKIEKERKITEAKNMPTV
jgi:hypothetical protein